MFKAWSAMAVGRRSAHEVADADRAPPCVPPMNMASYWVFLPAASRWSPPFPAGGAAQSGWTSYPPLADIAPHRQTMWLFTLIITSSFWPRSTSIVTIVQMRARVLSFLAAALLRGTPSW